MDKMKQMALLTALAVVAVLAGGWFLLVSPQSQKVSDLHAKTAAQQVTNQGLRTQIKVLKAQKADVMTQRKLLSDFQVKLPSNPALPGLIRDLSKAADDSGVDLVSIAPASPSALTAPAAGSAPTSTSTTSAAQPGAATGADELDFIGVSITVRGGFYHVEQFMNALESFKRVMLVNTLDMSHKDAAATSTVTSSTATTPDAVEADMLDVIVSAKVFMVKTAAAPVPASRPARSVPAN